MSVPPGYLSNAELAARVQEQTDSVKQFKDEQTNLYTTEEDTATVTNAEGVPVEVPSWKKVSQANYVADDALIAAQQAQTTVLDLQTRLLALEAAVGSGMKPYKLRSELPNTDPGDGARIAWVWNDPTPANVGAWIWDEDVGDWAKSPDLTSSLMAQVTDLGRTLEPIARAITEVMSDDILAFADAENKVVGRVRKDAAWDILLHRIRASSGLEIFEFDAIGYEGAVLVDRNMRIVQTFGEEGPSQDNSEVVAARGTRANLNARLSQSLTPYGMPRRHYWGEWYLRETRQRLRKLALGESTQLVVASIGDSWTHNGGRWSRPTAETLRDTYGDAGAGYVSFAKSGTTLPNGNVFSNSAVTYTGTWDTSAYNNNYSPDLGAATSSTATDALAYTVSGTPSAVNLFAKGGAGVVRYRFNGGSWTSVDLSALAAGLHVLPLSTPAAGVFELEVVSGTPVLFGIDVQQASSGVRWHKLGSTGSRASHWAAANSAQWRAGLQALAPNLVTIMLATNDQAQYDAATYRGHMQTLIGRVKSALPLADILLVAPCENGRANTWPMSDYAAALYELAADNRCAYLDLQYVFGDEFAEYASTSPRAWFNADLIHPEPQTGGRVIADAVLRLLTTL